MVAQKYCTYFYKQARCLYNLLTATGATCYLIGMQATSRGNIPERILFMGGRYTERIWVELDKLSDEFNQYNAEQDMIILQNLFDSDSVPVDALPWIYTESEV